MDNPAQDIAQVTPPQNKLRLIYLLTAVLAITIILIVLSGRFLPQKNVQIALKTKEASSKTTDYTGNLEKSIKTTFTSSSHKNIIDYINLASKEKDLDKRYEYYQKAFSKMSQAYQTTKNPEYKLVLYQLKDYVKVFPSYQEGDFVIPK